jgi:single-strand DNA-binding protein
MPNYCQITTVGHITKDPELRTTANGTSVCNSGIAYNNPMKKRDGEGAVFFGVTLWGKQAESFADKVTKGSCVLVTGDFDMNKWKTRDGEEREQPQITATKWNFMGEPPARNANAQNQEDYDRDREDAVPY